MGRPRGYTPTGLDEVKQQVKFGLTPTTANRLPEIAHILGLETKTDLLELLGHGSLVVVPREALEQLVNSCHPTSPRSENTRRFIKAIGRRKLNRLLDKEEEDD